MGFRLLATDFWYREMPGMMLLKMEQDLLRKIITNLPGNYLIQLGGPSDLSLVKKSPVKHKIYLSQQKNRFNPNAKIITDIESLPFLPASIDIAVVAHVLEFAQNPRDILNQLYEILVPNGYCIIFGFNYWSLWNCAKYYQKGEFPWSGRFLKQITIKRWLRSLHFRMMTSKTTCFRPPLQQYRLAKHLLFFEPIGQFMFPGMGGVFMIVVQKPVFAVTPEVEPVWWKKVLLNNGGVVKPTTRV